MGDNGKEVMCGTEEESEDDDSSLTVPTEAPPGGVHLSKVFERSKPSAVSKRSKHSWITQEKERIDPRTLAEVSRCIRCGCLRRTWRVPGQSIPNVLYLPVGFSVWRSRRDPCVDPRQEELFGGGTLETRNEVLDAEQVEASEREARATRKSEKRKRNLDVSHHVTLEDWRREEAERLAAIEAAGEEDAIAREERIAIQEAEEAEKDRENEEWWERESSRTTSRRALSRTTPVRVMDERCEDGVRVVVDYHVRDEDRREEEETIKEAARQAATERRAIAKAFGGSVLLARREGAGASAGASAIFATPRKKAPPRPPRT